MWSAWDANTKQVGPWLSAWCGGGREEGIPPAASLLPLAEPSLKLFPTWSQCPTLQDHPKSHMTWISTFRVHTHRPKWLAREPPPRCSSPHPAATLSAFRKPCLFSCSTFHGLDLQFSICTHSPLFYPYPWPLCDHGSLPDAFSPSQYSHGSWFYLWASTACLHALSVVNCRPMKVCRRHQYLHRMSCRLLTICPDSLKASA